MYEYKPLSTGPMNQLQGVNLQDQYSTINKAVTGGRPGALDYLFKMLDAMGATNQNNMAFDQYSQMRPYMTDAAQQGRESFSAAFPYLADPYMAQRNEMNKQQELWQMQKPMYQQKYNWMNQQWTNPYISPAYMYGAQ